MLFIGMAVRNTVIDNADSLYIICSSAPNSANTCSERCALKS